MIRFRIGTSGYSYGEWRGTFYPEELPEEGRLKFYAQRFSTVELNYTFHRMPNVRTVQSWAKDTPDDFLFALKAPRRVTHEQRLRDTAESLDIFCDITKVLKARLGPVLFQLPSFERKDVSRLEDFLHQVPPGLRTVFEFKHPSWLSDDVFDCLRRFEVALCITENEEHSTPIVATGPFGYFRLRKPEYGDEALAAIAREISDRQAEWKEAFVFFKHEAGGLGPQLAARLQSIVETPAEPSAVSA